MIRRTAAAILLLTATALVATGCGSSSSDSKDSSGGSGTKTTSTSSGDGSTTSSGSQASGGGDTTCTTPPGTKLQFASEPKLTVKKTDKLTATLKTSKGTIVAKLLPDQGLHAVNNFVFLARKGFYTCIPFHRVIEGFMIQTGDPEGTGTGGPGYTIADDKVTSPYRIGSLAMANTGAPNSGGSQFFIVQGQQGVGLPPSYPLFGQVTKGQDVVDALAGVATTGPEGSSPVDPIWLESVTISG